MYNKNNINNCFLCSVGQLNYWRLNSIGQIEELQSVGLQTGGTQVCESHEHDSLLVTAHTDPVMRLWTLNTLRQPIKRYVQYNGY